jgi:WD40 repeat protein
MVYNPNSADLITVGEGNEIYRLNLSMGRFQVPFTSDCEELNCIDYCSQLSMIGVGGIGGNPEFWDLNSRKKAHDLVLPQAIQG